MKTLNLKKNIALSLAALSLACFSQTASALEPLDIDAKDYIRVMVPAAEAEGLRLVYGLDGNKVEAFPADGDVIELNAEMDFGQGAILGNFSFLGSVEETGNQVLEIIGTQPIGYQIRIKFKSTDESDHLDSGTPLVLENAPGATVEVVQGGSPDEIQNEPAEPVFFGTEARQFNQEGVLDIRFFVVQPEDNEEGEDQGGVDEGQDNELNPEPESSGGCSLAATASGGALNLIALLPLAGLALGLRRRVQ